jgi:hypothetical protein
MSIQPMTMAEIKGVTLNYVARALETEGSEGITVSKTSFDKKEGANEQTEETLEDGVIVFFPNKTVQVMSMKRAEGLGFLRQPEILNLSQVEGQNTPAGRYKNAIKTSDRIKAWGDMENSLIQSCIARSGHPLPLDVHYSDKSIYLTSEEKNEYS